MKVNLENISGTERKLEVVISAEQVKEKHEEVFTDIKQNVKVKGFRPGKAPEGIVRSMYKDEIRDEVMQKLVNDTLQDALKEAEVIPVSQPDVTPPSEMDVEKDFEYSVKFEVLPDFELAEYRKLPLKREKAEVTDDEVDHAIKHLLERGAKVEPYEEEKELADGDVAIIDFEGSLDGKPLEDLKREDFQFVLGEKQVITEFEDNAMGMKKGEEKEFEVSYGEDFPIEEAKNKAVQYVMKLKDVLERTIPELDDEFAKEMGQDDTKSLQNKIREDLVKHMGQQSDQKLRQELIETLVNKNGDIEAPASLLHQEMERLAQNIAQGMQQRGIPAKPLDEEMQSKIAETAVRNVKASIILGEISQKESITATEDDLEAKLSEIAQGYNVTTDQIRDIYRENNMLGSLEGTIGEQKVIDFIIENAEIEEVAPEQNLVDKEL